MTSPHGGERRRISLDGCWQLFPDPGRCLAPGCLAGERTFAVEVPAPWQSQGPGLRDFPGPAWYRREFDLPGDWEGRRIILHFGAVDDLAAVWLNGAPLGEHQGAYLPFELDATAARPGPNELVVRVADDLETFPELPHGKQSWYGLLSGIWQPVWLEARPPVHIRRVHVTPDPSAGLAAVDVQLSGPPEGDWRLRCRLFDPGGGLLGETAVQSTQLSLPVPDPLLWEPDAPHLYTLDVLLEGAAQNGDDADSLRETFGFRTIQAQGGQILLNGRPVLLRGALDQDYYPDGISTPPSQEYIEDQFRQAQALGLNCLRIHIKIADPRYYAAADKVGLLIWTELPNWQTLTPEAGRRARQTLAEMIGRDWNHPSIIIWTIINESWGIDLSDPDQRRWLSDTYDYVKALDPHRLVVGNSACWGNAQMVTDIVDFHNYYAIPDHYQKWRRWVESFAGRPDWAFLRPYAGYGGWRKFIRRPWASPAAPAALEVRCQGDEPLVISEFGNWGLPDLDRLYAHYGGEPWWFESGYDWNEGVVLPHGIQARFRAYHLERAFPSLGALLKASQQQEFAALKFEVEEMRRHASLSGYVVTELTDVHWESNGLLDMLRQPKEGIQQLAAVNGDDALLPAWDRLSFREGERVEVGISLSHYSQGNLNGSRLEWRLEPASPGEEAPYGEIPGLAPRPYTVSPLGKVVFTAPGVSRPTRLRLDLRLITPDGSQAAASSLELFFYPAHAPQAAGVPLYAPGLEAPLSTLGYTLAESPEQASVAVVSKLTDELREYLLGGGQALLLAENPRSLRTHLGDVRISPRHKKVWQGDWASTFSWVNQDRLFHDLPTCGPVDFAFAGLTPEQVITGLGTMAFARDVHAALFVGWLHRAAAIVAERPVGRGRVLLSTFRLRRNLTRHPLAALLLDQMLAYLGRGRAAGPLEVQ